MKRDEEKINEWRRLLEERKEKGLSVAEFCKLKNIKVSQYYYYQTAISEPNQSRRNRPVRKTDQTPIKPIKIVEPARENSTIRFILPNSLQCILPRDMACHEIRSILEVAVSC
jgi:transcriptional regulator with XRE-family HTH domain